MINEKQSSGGRTVSVHWFRHGLRLHDNPALHEALNGADELYAVFIFDGESAGTKKVGYNRMQFLLESLNDLDKQLKAVGGRLYMLQGQPTQIFQRLKEETGVTRICFEQDCEPIWCPRDDAVKKFCADSGTEMIERVSHTLWDPKQVISTNGGMPPLTYQMFLHTVSVIGPPPRPVSDVEWTGVKFGTLPDYLLNEFQAFPKMPAPEYFGIIQLPDTGERMVHWEGGETNALNHLQSRISVEHEAFKQGYYLPNQARPDLVRPPTSQSAALRFGCLSVRRFYWTIHDLFNEVHKGEPPSTQNITGQLIWREYFYTMSLDNTYYAEMLRNPICLNIPWYKTDEKMFDKWCKGKTGYPFIDAAMRQLLQEGWIHHVARNAVATFLTRGDLWISWEAGLNHFLKYLLDADWSVCAGNWMWVSSSAFEQLLDCSYCMSPVKYGQRLDPWGEYVKRYVPELRDFPIEFLYEPWRASLEIQTKAGCVIGKDYPEPMVNHQEASHRNREMMIKIRTSLMGEPPHCCPSNREEVRQFMWLPDSCNDHVCPP